MTHCQRIFLIPGWQDSQGARIESFTAHVLGMTVDLIDPALQDLAPLRKLNTDK